MRKQENYPNLTDLCDKRDGKGAPLWTTICLTNLRWTSQRPTLSPHHPTQHTQHNTQHTPTPTPTPPPPSSPPPSHAGIVGVIVFNCALVVVDASVFNCAFVVVDALVFTCASVGVDFLEFGIVLVGEFTLISCLSSPCSERMSSHAGERSSSRHVSSLSCLG